MRIWIIWNDASLLGDTNRPKGAPFGVRPGSVTSVEVQHQLRNVDVSKWTVRRRLKERRKTSSVPQKISS